MERTPLLPLGPSPTYSVTAQQRSDQRYPAPVNTKGSAPLSNRRTKTKKKKKMAQMTEHFKAPEIIQLSSKQIANLSDTQFKTLVFKTLTELVEFVRKLDEKT